MQTNLPHVQAADENHGCPSWFVPVSNNSNRCKCGEPVYNPGRIVVCDPNTKQTLLLIGNCMDYNEEEDVVFFCLVFAPGSYFFFLAPITILRVVATRRPLALLQS